MLNICFTYFNYRRLEKVSKVNPTGKSDSVRLRLRCGCEMRIAMRGGAGECEYAKCDAKLCEWVRVRVLTK